MKILLHVLFFEWKSLWRSNTLKTLILVVLGTGIYGIYFGKFEIDKQEARISQVQQYERQKFDSLLIWVQLDTSLVENKEKYQQAISPTGVGWSKHFTYYVTNEAPDAAGLCLGQRDLFPVYYGINASDLARQVNTGELANPMKLLTGNFDLSYVFVFLFPLLVVALFYNLYANEKEGGTLALLKSQSVSMPKIFIAKGLLRFVIVCGLSILLLLLACLIQGISIVENYPLLFQWSILIVGYNLIWIALMSLIVWLRMGSSISAMIGLGVWLLFTLVTPALLNLSVLASEPLPNRAEMIHEVRNLNGRVWDEPKSFVLDQFYKDYPEYNDGDTTDFYKWYYASFCLIDKEANNMKDAFELQVARRNSLLKKWEWLAPAAMVHERLSQLSRTDRDSHLEFVKNVQGYHADIKKLYYDRIFDRQQFSLEDLKALENTL